MKQIWQTQCLTINPNVLGSDDQKKTVEKLHLDLAAFSFLNQITVCDFSGQQQKFIKMFLST